MNQTPGNVEDRSPLEKIKDVVVTVGAYASAYLFEAATRNPELYDAIVPDSIDVSHNTLHAGAWLALGGAVLNTCVIAARQK